MKKVLLLLVPLLLLVGCQQSSGGDLSALENRLTALEDTNRALALTVDSLTTENNSLKLQNEQLQSDVERMQEQLKTVSSASEKDVVVAVIETCGQKKGQACFQSLLGGPKAWNMYTTWDVTIRTAQGTTYVIELPFFDSSGRPTTGPRIGQSWP